MSNILEQLSTMVVNGKYQPGLLKSKNESNYKAIEWIRHLFGESMFYQILALLKKKSKKAGRSTVRRSLTKKPTMSKLAFKRTLSDIYNMICQRQDDNIPFTSLATPEKSSNLVDDIKCKIQSILNDA